MDRDIVEYTQVYKNHDFEEIMVKYRRKKVLEILNRYQAKTILEIGCGLDSIFNYYKDFKKFFVVEPSKEFYQKAAVDKHSSNIYIYITM